MSPVDVVIVGGGPTGLLLAGELRLGGVEVIVLERLAAPTGLSKALGVAGRGAQTLNYRGLLNRLDGAALGWAKFTHFGGIPLDLARLESASPDHLPPSLTAPQAQVERVLEEWAVELGAQLRRGHQVTGLTQTTSRSRSRSTAPAVATGSTADTWSAVTAPAAWSAGRPASASPAPRPPRSRASATSR